MPEPEPTTPPHSQPPMLDYATPSLEGMVRIARYIEGLAADMAVNRLKQAGIFVHQFGANTAALGFGYQLLSNVELYVRADEAQQAMEVLSQDVDELLEPADEPESVSTPADVPAGATLGEQPATEPAQVLVEVGAYEYLRQLRDVEAILASAGIPTIPPRLVNRGDNPAGSGKRFILRVAQADLTRAQRILAEEEDETSDDPRCPKCASWNVTPVTRFWKDLAVAIGLVTDDNSRQLECRNCHYLAEAAQFKGGKM